MAEEKWKSDLIRDAITRDEFSPDIIRVPRKAKHRKGKYEGKIPAQPDLHVGKPVVVRVYESSDVKGYLLCRLLDYAEIRGMWETGTQLILYIQDASQKELERFIGRLVAVTHSIKGGNAYTLRSRWFKKSFQFSSFNKDDFVKIKEII